MRRLIVGIAVATTAMTACGDDATQAPTGEQPVSQLTVSGTSCAYDGPTEISAGTVTIEIVNQTGQAVDIDVWKLDEGRAYEEFVAHLDEEMRLMEADQPGLGPPSWVSGRSEITVETETGSQDVTMDQGTWVFACIPFDPAADEPTGIFPAGPVEVTSPAA